MINAGNIKPFDSVCNASAQTIVVYVQNCHFWVGLLYVVLTACC